MVSAGHVSFAQVAFMGIGAYTTALLTKELHWTFWSCLPLSGFVAASVALPLGYITLRIKGVYFIVATFALGEVIRLVWIEWSSLFKGPGGIPDIPLPSPIFGWEFGSASSFYYLILCLLIFTMFAMYGLDRSRFGMTLLTFEQAEDLAESVGINAMKYKVIAFVIASFFAGITGAFYATFHHYISPDDFSLTQSLYVVVYTAIGGTGSLYGPVVGCFTLILLPALLHYVPGYEPVLEPLIYGSILIIILLLLPAGLVSLGELVFPWARKLRDTTGGGGQHATT